MARSLPALVAALLAALLAPASAAEEPLRTPPDRPVDVVRIALDLAVDLEAREVRGHADVEFVALRAVRTLTLDAVGHEVEGVERLAPGAEPAACGHSYDGRRLTVELPETARGEGHTVRVRYRVRRPEAGLHFFGPTEAEPDVPWQVWSQGESTFNRHWFPCVDHPDERQATALVARVRPGLTVVSNGRLLGVEEDPESGLAVWRFEQERPHVAYLVSLVVGTFRSDRGRWGELPLATHIPPEYDAATATRSFGRTGEMLELFTRLTGVPYPWPKYDQVVVEQFSWGGMENTGATTLNERTLHDARAHLDTSSEGLVAHELAHQWYGDLLTCRDWSHLWLNESFATYLSALWKQHAEGEDAFALDMLGKAASGMAAGKARPILDRRYPDPGSMFDGRAYPKGAAVLHMLRRQLGEDAFWRGVRAYTRAHQDRGVETSDLRRALEEASGRNLERFFHDWVERAGHPALKVTLTRDPEQGLTAVTLEQTQDGEPYRFPAELRFGFGTQSLTRTLAVDERRERWVFSFEAEPDDFRFDPREAVLLKELEVDKPAPLWARQLRRDDAAGRVRAARALAARGRPEDLELLVAALAEDPFWGVRAEVARALAGVGGDPVRDALLGRVVDEPHPKARRAAVEALAGRGRDPQVANALAGLLERGDPSYHVEAAATEAYARTAAEPRPLLLAQLAKPSHNEVIRLAAVRGLRAQQDPELAGRFAALLAPEHPPEVRREAARALSVVGLPGASEATRAQAVGALVAALQRAGFRGRRAALGTLEGLGGLAAAALEEVDRVARLAPEHRLRTAAERAAAAIRAGRPPDMQLADLREEAAALRRDAEALREAKQDLEARVRRLEERASAAPEAEGAR